MPASTTACTYERDLLWHLDLGSYASSDVSAVGPCVSYAEGVRAKDGYPLRLTAVQFSHTLERGKREGAEVRDVVMKGGHGKGRKEKGGEGRGGEGK